MGQALVTLPDGRKAKVTFDSPEQLDATIADLTRPEKRVGSAGDAAADLVTSVGGSIVGGALGGVAGIARGAGAGAASLAQGEGFGKAADAFTDEATSTIEGVQGAVSRATQPNTQAGETAVKGFSAPFTWLAKKADKAGEVVSDVTGSPALGALTNTAVQSLPSAIVPGLRGVRSLARGAAPAAATEALTATGAARTAPSTIGEVEHPTGPVGAPGAPGQAPPTAAPTAGPAPVSPKPAAPSPNEARAEAYARSIGLDWSGLGAGVKKALTTIAQDSKALQRLDPAAVKRQALLQGQRVPVPATRGQLTRDPVELRREAITSRTSEGGPIRQVDVDANRAVQANLELIRGRVAGKKGGVHDPGEEGSEGLGPSKRDPTKAPSEVGRSVTGAATEKAKWSKKGYDALYKLARKTEPDAQASVKPISDLLTSNPEIQHLGWLQSWLSKAAKVKVEPGAEVPPLEKATLAELHDLRSTAGEIARTGGKEGHYASQVVKAIDAAMEDVPAGAAAWKRANEAFKKHQQEFKEQGAVRGLVSKKKGTSDPAIEADKVWGKIKSGSIAQIRQIKQTLLTGGTAATRMAGKRAWRDIRGETVNRILEDARNVVATDETERQILTAAALRKAVNQIPRENLEEILGKQTTRELYDLVRVAKITRTQPSARVTESGTVPNALIMAEKVLGHIPGGKYAIGGAKALKSLKERGGAAVAARRATADPLAEAATQVAKRAPRGRAAQAIRDLEEGGPTLPGPAPEPTIGQALKPKKP